MLPRRSQVILILLVLLIPSLASAGWMARIVSARATFAALAVGPDGNTHYIYTVKGTLAHRVLNAQGRTTASEIFPGSYSPASIAIDRNNHLHLLFSRGSDGQRRYGFFDGTTWSFQDIPIATGCNNAPNIAVDANNLPHFACLTNNYYANPVLTHWSFDGQAWSSETVVGYSYSQYPPIWGYPANTSTPLRIAADGSIHIGFVNQTFPYSPDNFVCEAVKRENVWSSNCNITPGGNTYLAMALDKNGNPHFCYYLNGLLYVHFDGANWSSQLIDSKAYDGAIVIGNDDLPRLLFVDRQKPRRPVAVYAAATSDGWSAYGVAAAPDFQMYGSEADALALDPLGLPHGGLSVPVGGGYAVYGQLTLPDLTATWDSITTGTLRKKFMVTAKLRVKNGGTATATGFKVTYFLSDDDKLDKSDVQIGKAAVSGIAVGKERVINFNYQPSAAVTGKYLIAQIEPKTPDQEATTDNNLATGEIP